MLTSEVLASFKQFDPDVQALGAKELEHAVEVLVELLPEAVLRSYAEALRERKLTNPVWLDVKPLDLFLAVRQIERPSLQTARAGRKT